MPVKHARVTVGTTAVLIFSGSDQDAEYGEEITVQNLGANAVHLGDSAVTATTGYTLAVNAVAKLTLAPGDELYGICAAAQSAIVHVLATR